jgi:hypothetical protein
VKLTTGLYSVLKNMCTFTSMPPVRLSNMGFVCRQLYLSLLPTSMLLLLLQWYNFCPQNLISGASSANSNFHVHRTALSAIGVRFTFPYNACLRAMLLLVHLCSKGSLLLRFSGYKSLCRALDARVCGRRASTRLTLHDLTNLAILGEER